jgi:hypothetical protein
METYIFFWKEYNLNGTMVNDGWFYCTGDKEALDAFKEFEDTKYASWAVSIRNNEMMDADEFKMFLDADMEE